MKTHHKKVSNSICRPNKFGHFPYTVKGVKDIFKLNRAMQNPTTKSNTSIGFTRSEETEALALEAQAKRDQGRAFACITPLR